MVSKLKRSLTEWEKIFTGYTSNIGLITRIHREFKIKKRATELNRTFSKEEMQMVIKHIKKCSPSLAINEMKIKSRLRFHLTPVRIPTIKNTNNSKCCQGCG
jgi:ADP-dependent phosphofructokinase/glucokinase